MIKKTSILGFTYQDLKFIFNFCKMNIRDRYLGSSLGSIWAVLNPLLMLGIYTFVFGYVFKSKLPGSDTTLSYAIWLISGYGPWLAINESIMAATTSVVSGAGLIKNIAFKTEVLPVASSLVGFVPLAVSILFLLILLVIDGNLPTWHVIIVIPVTIILFWFIIAISFFLSAINVFIRDVSVILPNLLMMLLFATPIFYPLELVPGILQIASQANPFYILAEAYRECILNHNIPNLIALGYVLLISYIIYLVGLKFFQRLKGYFDAFL
ncbi:ABC transporter permease [Cuspidothrix issatschenkoi]|nr:ABC transporter permease [Cuspidothrix issatschenkoi]